jgi:hypothetical protein
MSDPSKVPTSNSAAYLAYLDKEMTIMAALTGATGGASLYLVKEILFGSLVSIAEPVRPFLIVGLGALGAATLLFYLQRSHMVWCYGAITLALSGRRDLEAALKETDSWYFWLRYRLAFVVVGLAAAELFLAVLVKLESFALGSVGYVWLSAVGLVVIACVAGGQQIMMVCHRDQEASDS